MTLLLVSVSFPLNFDKTITKIMWTSSVEEFNNAFDLTANEQKDCLYNTTFTHRCVVTHLASAQHIYRELVSNSQWLSTSVGASSFTLVGKKELKCWNCGQNHALVDKCLLPRNEAKIDLGKKAFCEA